METAGIGFTTEDLPPLGMTPLESRFDFRIWWEESRRHLPFDLEIGFGKGAFLLAEGRHEPHVNFLGVEYVRQFWLFAADRIRRHGLPNVKMLYSDAVAFVGWRCPDAVFRNVHIYFPDPWPKTKHNRRRMVQESNLRDIHRILAPGGQVRIVTDHEDYFAWMEEHAARVADLYDRQPFEKSLGVAADEVVGTNFERKYRREGRPFHAMSLVRR